MVVSLTEAMLTVVFGGEETVGWCGDYVLQGPGDGGVEQIWKEP